MSRYVPRHALKRSGPARSKVATRLAVGAIAGAGALGSLGLAATTASAATASDWEKIAACESGGNWSINTGNGYYGGVQFSESTWLGYGGGSYASTASQASESQQIAIANRVLAAQGWGAWPVCSVKAGLSGTSTSGGSTTASGGSSGSSSRSSTGSTSTTTTRSSSTGSSSAAKAVAPKAPVLKVPSFHPTLLGHVYTVRAGDTLSTITKSQRVHGGWRMLWAANSHAVKNPDMIKVGQHLHLPKTVQAHRA